MARKVLLDSNTKEPKNVNCPKYMKNHNTSEINSKKHTGMDDIFLEH